MFIHDFAEVALPFSTVRPFVAAVPTWMAALIGPSFDLTMAGGGSPWPVVCSPIRQREDGVVVSLFWEGGRGGMIPTVEADLGFFPSGRYTSHIEVMGTYSPVVEPFAGTHSRSVHFATVMGVRRLLMALADRLSPEPIPL